MPQLDTQWFTAQLFWLAICLVVLYTALSRYILPRLMGVIEARINAREGDLARAEALKIEAARAEETYASAMAETRLRAQAILSESEQQSEKALEEATASLNRTLIQNMADADTRIAAQRDAVMAQLEPAAVELAALIVHKLTGLNAESDRTHALIRQQPKVAR